LYQPGVFHSNDGGSTWSKITFGAVSNSNLGRASVASLGEVAYAVLGASDGVEYAGLFESTDSGATWIARTVPSATVGGVTIDGTSAQNFSQSAFDQALAIDPSDPSGATLVFGGVGIYRSTNSGASWTFLAQ